MERDRFRHSKSHRGQPDRRPVVVLALLVVGVFLVAGAAAGVVAWSGGDGEDVAGLSAVGASSCTPVDVTTSTSFEPVLREVAASLRQGENCADVRVNVADGRPAADALTETSADVWIPDDASWAGVIPEGVLAPDPDGRPEVLAQSPFYMVTDAATAARIKAAGGTWRGLAGLFVPGTGLRMVVRDPAASGDGMVAAAGVGEAVWVAEGMDASSLALATAFEVTRTVRGSAPALPKATGDVGVVPEYALLRFGVPEGAVVVAGSDNTPTLRFAWLPTAHGAARADRAPALRRLHDALVGEAGLAAVQRAGLRGPDGAAAPGTASRLPAATAKPFDILGPHHVEHVFATWYPEVRRADLLMVVDVSGSMGRTAPDSDRPLIDLVRDGVTEVGKLLPDDSRIGLWEFGSRLDGANDYREVLPPGDLDKSQRGRLGDATAALRAQQTGTGLYDTILAAYETAQERYRGGVLSHVFVFTDGRNQDDPGSVSLEQLTERLTAAQDPQRPVALSVVAFGDAAADVEALTKALEPVDADVEALTSAKGVPAVFVHVAAGGPH
jgi:Ca-activated chloride channel homolog